MIYEYFVRLLGKSIITVIYFILFQAEYRESTVTVSCMLKDPVTAEIMKLVRQHFTFGIEYYVSMTVNTERTYNTTVSMKLSWNGTGWECDGHPVAEGHIQDSMGMVQAHFNNITFKEDDAVLFYVQAHIASDAEFEKSTGLKTDILWNYYFPSKKREYVFKNERLGLLDDTE